MRLMRVGEPGHERPVLVAPDGTARDLRPVTDDIDGRFLAALADDPDLVPGDPAALPVTDLAGERTGPPVARPSAVLCIGQNYIAHARESGAEPPERPILFHKTPNTVVGPDDDILIPRGALKTDWEVELAVVIGRRARYLATPADALAHIAGYTISNDVSERAFQLEESGGQWSKGKCCETFNPLGPVLVTADEIPDPQALRLRSWVNGEPRQDSSTSDMIFGVAQLVHELSQYLVLEPGDIVNTGTPEGVALSGRFPYLAAGDVVELEIEGIGRQRSALRPAP
ncbi:fumarylacetoacetate hydrolase family protein [Streptomyces sp. RFCAC02]|uniref:fumarylacetoacetate hydrolase family protein n=1 Tax=Streptomyces sp. RFCAC02 TaxID=2499143 RepID=UPI001022572B|nr:fumarylacetoacetate hydrolase family protein [Streptomyces sp. RFCAC02]